jgi:outer membrane protein assembly factor BamB
LLDQQGPRGPYVSEPRRRLPQNVYYQRRLIVSAVAVVLVLLCIAVVNPGSAPAGKYPGSSGGPSAGRSPAPLASGRGQLAHPGGEGTSVGDTASGPVPSGSTFLPPLAPGTPTYLMPGSDPNVLPGPVLVADKLNNRLLVVDPQGHIRWTWPQPGDLAAGQTFLIPDDAFFSPDGRYIIATQEDDFVISVIDIATGKIVWRYGHPGVAGSGPGYLWNPDDAMILRNGDVISADIKNCRIITVPLGGANISWEAGIVGSCTHDPPVQFGSPNGVFLMRNGHFLVTEINGDWVDEIDTSGHVYWSVNPPGVNYPSDSNQVGPDRYMTVDYSYPGQIVVFNRAGQTLWRYAPTTGAPAELDHPSLAMALPNGDVFLNDDYDDRVIVVDPRTNQIVWQFGHDGVAGSSAGYLDNPDGVDLLPPFSYANRYQPPATLTP